MAVALHVQAKPLLQAVVTRLLSKDANWIVSLYSLLPHVR